MKSKDTTINPQKASTNFNYNRRKYHRVKVNHIECSISFVDFGTNKLLALVNKTVLGHIDDVSLGGIKLTAQIDLPVQYLIISDLSFTLKNQQFNLKGEFVRKETKKESHYFIYGIKFLDMKKSDENKLASIINEIELSKRDIG
ncbi:PilZ domain-containing protein [Bacillaceae bacterium S4-13-56]